MRMLAPPRQRSFRLLPLLAAGLCLGAGAARAQQQPTPLEGSVPPAATVPSATPIASPYDGSLWLAKGTGRLIKLPRAVANIFAADPTVAEVRPASPDTLFVFGKGTGETTIVATDNDGTPIAHYTVSVGPSAYSSDRLEGAAQLSAPDGLVTAATEAGGMVVRGTVQTPEEANDVMNQAKLISPNGTALNQLTVSEPIQVELKVRIASMSRTVTRELGIDWSSVGTSAIKVGKFALTGFTGTTPGSLGVTFPGGTFEGIIDALAADNLAQVLAEPTLTTLSGTQASFQVGGQFPIPESAGLGAVTVTYKNFGVLLTFTPTVFSDGRIALQVAPQLSSVSTANSAVLSETGSSEATAVPSLNVTTASSTVILGSGQGMAIAGLLEDTTNQVDNGVPGLGEVPVLGALFRGDAFQRQQQELVITVTPYIVNPVDHPALLASPDDGWTPANDLQRILLLRDNGTDSPGSAIPGDAGFVVQ
jgi:pilus assembly protein CpaC